MMIVQILSEDELKIHEIADMLLQEALLATAIIGDPVLVKSKTEDNTIVSVKQYRLQGISKSLLFPEINARLKARYKENMPLLYSEPIILIDSFHQDTILDSLTKV